MSSLPELNSDNTPAPPKKRSHWWWPLVAGILYGIAIRLVFSGEAGGPYNAMMSSFTLLVPVLVGAVTVMVAERTSRRSWSYYFWAAAAANVLFVVGTLALTIEGLICCILAVPLFAVLGGIGGLLTGVLCRQKEWSRHSVFGLSILPLALGALEQHVPLPNTVLTAEQSRTVSAPPREVWKHLLFAKSIQPDELDTAWMYRIGVPVPLAATSEERDHQLVRHITMGKDIHFDQVSTIWEAGRRVLWTYRFAKDSFPPHALDDHVRIGGRYFDVIDTECVIKEVPNGSLLRVVMHYRVSTNFNWYVRPIAHFLVVNFEKTALAFYAHRAEANLMSETQTSS